MAFAATRETPNRLLPIGEINTTPLIDVMLVLLVMLILTIPMATQSVDMDLPQVNSETPLPPLDHHRNRIVLTAGGAILWNGNTIDMAQLDAELADMVRMRPEPELQFEPEAQAGYDLSAHVLRSIKLSGATRFGFVGNERYRSFGRQD
jgi:biopolymer transport protein ExbD